MNQIPTECRRRIATAHYRNVLWLDDEIRPESDEPALTLLYRELFHPLQKQFHKLGLFCQLKGFPSTTGEDDPYAPPSEDVQSCALLAEFADIIILDWHLGSADARNSIEIIRNLLAAGGHRFIVLLSQEPRLENEFLAVFRDELSKTDDSGWYSSPSGLHVLLLLKSNFRQPAHPASLVEEIYNKLSNACPDYIHWAAIELMSKIKVHAPKWLADIPVNTDLAVLLEAAHSQENIAETVVCNLMEDISTRVDHTTINILDEEQIKFENWAHYESTKADVLALSRANRPVFENLRKLVHVDTQPPPLGSNNTSCYKAIVEATDQINVAKRIHDSVMNLGHFCETTSISERSLTTRAIQKGSIFRANDDIHASNIILCISAECDCLRSDTLNFIEGQKMPAKPLPTGNANDTFLCFRGHQYLFRSDSPVRVLSYDQNTRTLAGFTPIGIARKQVTSRIVHRHAQTAPRVGVDQPRFVRNSRLEQ